MTTAAPARDRWRWLAWALIAAGAAASIGILIAVGWEQSLALLAASGPGVVAAGLINLVAGAFATLAWQAVLDARPGYWRLYWARWVGDSVNRLLPVAQIGGEVLRGQLARRQGATGADATASIVLDLTSGLVTLILYILLGLAVLAWAYPGMGATAGAFGFGAVVFIGLLVLLVVLQRGGALGLLATLGKGIAGGGLVAAMGAGIAAADRAIRDRYRHPKSLIACLAWRFAAWLTGAVETWLMLRALGVEASLVDALIIESLTQAARNLGFAVPASLGVQEGGILLAGTLVGLPPEAAVALAIAKRLRDLVLGIPALLWWQVAEWRRLRG